jgi:hypothetical protein
LLKEVRVVAVRRIHFASIGLGHGGCGLLCFAKRRAEGDRNRYLLEAELQGKQFVCDNNRFTIRPKL